MSKRSLGSAHELKARKELESLGYLVEKKNPSRWQGNDFWGEFDIIALSKDGSEIRLIQVKTHITDFSKAKNRIRNWILANNVTNISCEVWMKEPRKAWTVYVVNK